MVQQQLLRVANLIGYGTFILMTAYSLLMLPDLPQQVAIHFNIAGEADNWGSKYVLLLIPVIVLFMTLAMEAVEKHPEWHNYPASKTKANEQAMYKISQRTMNLVKNAILLIFSLLQLEMIRSATTENTSIGAAFFVLLLTVVVAPLIWHFASMRKL